MLIWAALFVIIFLISLVLAFKSLSDYRENPLLTKVPYSVYLIQKPENLNLELLKKLHSAALKEKLLFSLEKLFRGDRKALVIFGTPSLLQPFKEELGLLELEDYTQKLGENFSAWEVGKKNQKIEIVEDILTNIPKLEDTDQFWWQLVLSPQSKIDNDSNYFTATTRAVLQGGEGKRLQNLQEDFSKIGESQGLAMLPQSYSSAQIAKFYQQRVIPKAVVNKSDSSLTLSGREVLQALGL